MISPDGQMGDIPHEQVSSAVAAGFKIGADLVAPNGTHGVVPLDRVHEAIGSGFMLKGADIPKPQTDMQESGLAHALNPSQSVAGTDETNFVAENPNERQALATAAAVGAGGQVAGPTMEAVASKYPWVWKAAKTLAASEAIGQARKIPYAGKLIPPGSEILPFLGLGGKAAPAAAEAATEAEAPAGAAALGDLPATGALPASQTGEALGTIPTAPWRMKPQAAALGDAPVTNPASVTARQFTNRVGPMIDEGLGNPPAAKPAVNPGQPIYRRTVAAAAPEAEAPTPVSGMPEGSVPVDSKALKSYHYDEPSQTMTVELNQGSMHRYAPVAPEQAQDFADAPSKGRAWLDLKNQPGVNHTAANYGSGWVNKVSRAAGSDAEPATPAETPKVSTGDLTGMLQQSVDAAKKAKWKMKAAP
jgi:hypothetical protein